MATAVTTAGRVRLQQRSPQRRVMPKAAWWAVSIAFTVMFIFPIYVAISSSLKTPKEAAQIPPTLIPHGVSFQNYSDLRGGGSSINVVHNIGNSVMVSRRGDDRHRGDQPRWAATRSRSCAFPAATWCSSPPWRRS